MTKEEKEEKTDYMADRCAEYNCTKERAERHLNLYLHEQWDVHPTKEFCEYLRSVYSNFPKMNTVTAWNSLPELLGFEEWINYGKPGPANPSGRTRKELKAELLASMEKIESRCSRGRLAVVAEETNLSGYDKR